MKAKSVLCILLSLLMIPSLPTKLSAQRPHKPVLHGKRWVAITGKPLAAMAGAMVFQKGSNAVDAACAMIADTSTIWDTLSWGGETDGDSSNYTKVCIMC